jgi:DNA-binding response OmpR family regulator
MRPQNEPLEPSHSPRVSKYKTILLVDDDRQLADSLQQILADEDYLVDVAYDGEEAMQKVSANAYDAVVCDIMLPKLRGDDFYRQAIETHPELRSRFLFITGSGNDPDVRSFLSRSGLKFLFKPFPVNELIDGVKELSASH